MRARNHDQLVLVCKKVSRKLRRHSTHAERIFWKAVRNRNFLGMKFYRQHPLSFGRPGEKGFFVADFYCHELRLVVEIDGEIHDRFKDYDAAREEAIRQMGIFVVRFENSNVEHNIGDVLEKLKSTISNIKSMAEQQNQLPPSLPKRPLFSWKEKGGRGDEFA